MMEEEEVEDTTNPQDSVTSALISIGTAKVALPDGHWVFSMCSPAKKIKNKIQKSSLRTATHNVISTGCGLAPFSSGSSAVVSG